MGLELQNEYNPLPFFEDTPDYQIEGVADKIPISHCRFIQRVKSSRLSRQSLRVSASDPALIFYNGLQKLGIVCPGPLTRAAVWQDIFTIEPGLKGRRVIITITDYTVFTFLLNNRKIIAFRHFYYSPVNIAKDIKSAFRYFEETLNCSLPPAKAEIIDFRILNHEQPQLRGIDWVDRSLNSVPPSKAFDSIYHFFAWAGARTFLRTRYLYLSGLEFSGFKSDYIPSLRLLITLGSALLFFIALFGRLHAYNLNMSKEVSRLHSRVVQKNIEEKEIRFASLHIGNFVPQKAQSRNFTSFLNQIGAEFEKRELSFVSLDYSGDNLILGGFAPAYRDVSDFKSIMETRFNDLKVEVIRSERTSDEKIRFTMMIRADGDD